jgi:uncharacterized protein (DUF4415 family)
LAKKLLNNHRYGRADADSPKITAELFARMRPAAEVDPGLVAAGKRARGRPPAAAPKKVVSVRMHANAAAAFKKLTKERRAALIGDLEAFTLKAARAADPRAKVR